MQSTIHPRLNLLRFYQRIPKLPWCGAVLFAVSMIAGPAARAQTTKGQREMSAERQPQQAPPLQLAAMTARGMNADIAAGVAFQRSLPLDVHQGAGAEQGRERFLWWR